LHCGAPWSWLHRGRLLVVDGINSFVGGRLRPSSGTEVFGSVLLLVGHQITCSTIALYASRTGAPFL
jgi:hypothetical protein